MTKQDQVNLGADELELLHEAAVAWADIPDANSAVRATVGSGEGAARGKALNSDSDQDEEFDRISRGWIRATPRASQATTPITRFEQRLRRLFLGAPLSSEQSGGERLGKVKALAILSSDALSSVAYATDQTILVLAAAGAVAISNYTLPIMVVILALLAVIVLSYRQTIQHYPNGGGSYIVAKDNLGPTAGLVAAAALLIDYVLTVSVSVAAGGAAIISAWPSAEPYTVQICVAMIVLIALGNLRGIREAGSLFAVPTYLFIGGIFITLATIAFRLSTGHINYPDHYIGVGAESLSILLVTRAFASGCTALTGVEAISNGVPVFKDPAPKNARRTLTLMGVILGAMFLGITLLTHTLHLVPKSNDTIISQLSRYAFGAGSIGYYFITAATTTILILAANTSFNGFPRLFYVMSRDGYAPHQFQKIGDRLAFSNGIIVLAILATILIAVFHGQVEALIPLYTIGVFLAFTLSQAGMVARWHRLHEPGWRRGIIINSLGMIFTAVVFIVTAVSKFASGAWVVLLIIPILSVLFYAIHNHYSKSGKLLMTEVPTSPTELRPLCIVPVYDFGRLALQSLAMARSISDEVIAVHINDDAEAIAKMRAKWQVWGNHVPLEIIESPYRSIVRPLLAYIDLINKQHPDNTIVVVLPEMVATKWWHQLLHNQTALRIKATLLFRPGTVVVNVPYHLG